MKMKRLKFCSAILVLAFAGIGLAGTLFAAEPLEIISGDYSAVELNSELFGHDSIEVNSSGTVNFNLDSSKIETESITVTRGTLNWNADSPNTEDYIFDGNITVNPGAELFLNGADPLGNSYDDEGSWRTLNVGGTLRLSDGSNKTMRRVTLNLTGGTVTDGTWQYRSNASVLQATSGDSTFESTLYFRSDVTAPKITVSDGASLTFTGNLNLEGSIDSLTFDGEGTTTVSSITGASGATIGEINVSNGKLVLPNQVGRIAPVFNVTDGGTLHLGIGDTLGANGDPISLNVGEGSALDFDAEPNSLGYWNQSGRNMTINLTGATMKNGNIHVFSESSDPTTINILASSITTEISTTLELRTSTGAAEDHLINVANGAAATDLLISGTVQGSSSNQYLVLTGGGTTKLTGNLENTITKMTLDGTTLQLGKDDSMSVKTNLYTSLSTGEGDETVVNNGTFDLNGHSTQLGYLSGSGQVINSGETTSVITLNNAWNSTFSGTVSGAVNFVKTGPGKWYLTGKSDWTGTDSFDIQEGIVILSGKRADGDQRRFMSGNLTIGEDAQLTLNSTDTLGNAMNGSWEGQGLDVNILGTLEIAASGNQTSRYINYNLYGGTINITNASGNIFYVNDITTITSYAKYGTQDVTETSVINGTLAVREGTCELTVNVEDGFQDTDMLWTGWLKNVNNNQKGSIEKIGDGTLRLTSMEGKTFDHKNGTNVEAGRLILDAASMTGSDVTVAQDAVFAAVNGSVIGKNLNVNGTYELILEEIAASEEEFQLMISDQLLFGDYATARINASGDVNWNALNGKTILRLHSADYATEVLDTLKGLLASDPYYPYVQLITEGVDIRISSFEFNEVPEPASWLLLLFGAAGLAWGSRSSRLKSPRFATPHA